MTVDEDQAKAEAQVWTYASGFVKTPVVKAAVELGIPDVLEKHGGPMPLSELSSAVGCPSAPLFRIMRFLIHYGIFKRSPAAQPPAEVCYAQTPLSRLLTGDRMAPYILLHGTHPSGVEAEVLRSGVQSHVKDVKGEEKWTDEDMSHGKLFTDAMTAHARVTAAAIAAEYPEAFQGVESVVDVGGRHGMAMGLVVNNFPWVRGITLDLPEIVATAPSVPGVEFVGGSMFDSVPKADVAMLMSVLHDWSDESCIDILKKCKEAVPADTGKVMIVDAIIDDDGDEGDEYTEARLMLDMVMLAVTVKGKERTYKEWVHLLKEAGFSRHTVKNIHTVEFVIEAYP